MITEDYCSYEISKLLKEKGFDECIFEFYEGNKIKYARNGEGFRLSELDSDIYYPHITHQMAMKWLREIYDIFIVIRRGLTGTGWVYSHEIYKDSQCWYARYGASYDTYEEAIETGIKYCLENLI